MKTTFIGWILLLLGWACLGIGIYANIEFLSIIACYIFGISTGFILSTLFKED